MSLKTYDDYCKEYEDVLMQGRIDGKQYIVKRDVYIAMTFLDDIGVSEPWADDAPDKLCRALEKHTPADKKKFLNVISDTINMIKKEGEKWT